MDIANLWEKLPLSAKRKTVFKKDISEGKVPELPFYIIGQAKVKSTVKNKLSEIDGDRMLTNLIIADYGNGKTNLLKYLQLFFETHNDYGVTVQYSRADVERPDLVLFLLKIVQDQYFEDLVSIINSGPKQADILDFVNNYESNFREIKKYTKALFDSKNTDEDIEELLYLGTGRFYNKKYFEKRNLQQFHDFNRREVLVLFLNILSYGNKYILFAIDEIEKIREKSKIRFNHFLTSYRELVDLFNQINGHYLMVSFTTGSGEEEIGIANDALYTRIKPDIIQIEGLDRKDDIMKLIEYLNELFETEKDPTDIYKSYSKNKAPNNRLAIQSISSLLQVKRQSESLDEILEKSDLVEIYNETKERLIEDEVFKNIHRKFFDPLDFYLEAIQVKGVLQRQDRLFIDHDGERVNYFIFNTYLEDFDNEREKIISLQTQHPDYSLTIFSPVTLGLALTSLDLNDISNLEIIDYDPQELFTLLEVFRENYDLQVELIDIISQYTNQRL